MTSETNKAIVHRYVEEGYNAGNLAVLDELCAPDLIYHDPPQPAVRDLSAMKQLWTAQRAAFADLRVTIEDMVAEGDKVVKRFTLRGTHTGDFDGLPPTGKQFTLEGITIVRLADAKIQEIWEAYDMLGVLQQLGVIPQAEAVAA